MSSKRMLTGLVYDPPEGWKYGFPKTYTPHVLNDKVEPVWQTLLRDGYPLSEIKDGMDKYVRFIGSIENFKIIPKGSYADEPEHIKNAANFPND